MIHLSWTSCWPYHLISNLCSFVGRVGRWNSAYYVGLAGHHLGLAVSKHVSPRTHKVQIVK